jgi:hypothetical protein
MEYSQTISDDESRSATQTSASANNETTARPESVEPESASQQKENNNADTKTSNTSFVKTLKISPREIEFLNRHRNKTRLCDPKGVYEFRHIQQSWFQSFMHVITMVVSLTCIIGKYYYTFQNSNEILVGIGEVSSLTWIDALEVIIIVGIIFMAIKNIRKQAQQHPQKRYRLAMFANAFNRMLLNNLRMFLVVCLLFLAINVLQDSTLSSINFEMSKEGATADLARAICSLVFIIICFRAFRFCGKELTA